MMEYTNEQISNAAKWCLEHESCQGCPFEDIPALQECLKVFAETIIENMREKV